MITWINPFIDKTVQCWGCPVFDRLFYVVSTAAGAAYRQISFFAIAIFCVLFAFYVVSVVFRNLRDSKKAGSDPFFQSSLRSVVINSLVAMGLLAMGLWLPRFIATITFEPAAQITATYTQAVLNVSPEFVEHQVTYTPTPMSDTGFYRPQLRDTVILIMKTTVTQFQSYMKLGIAVIDSAFNISDMFPNIPAALVRHGALILLGLYLFYSFFNLFVRFCFYFADIILAMTFFAFLFPLSLVLVAFRGADGAPKWMGTLGKNVGTDQFKKVIGAIVGLGAAVMTYTVIMVILAKFFAGTGTSMPEIMEHITNGNIYKDDLSQNNIAQITVCSVIVLVYVLNYIYSQIPKAAQSILDAFDVKPETKLGEELANDVMGLTKAAAKSFKNVVSGATKDSKAGTKK